MVGVPVVVHYLSLPLGLALLLYMDRRLWFISDIFEFFARMQPGHALNVLYPHNEHWSTIPILVNLVLYHSFGLHTYVPYLLVALLAHALVAHLVWRWMVRLGAGAWLATGLAAVFLVLGAGVENLTSSFQLGFVLPVALGLIGCLLVDFDGPGARRDLGFWPIGLAALMCSGIGVPMLVLAAMAGLFRRGWVAAVRIAAVPALVYVVWVLTFARGTVATTPAPKWELTLVPQYVWTGISTAVSDTTGLAGIGGILFIALGVWLYRNRDLARGNLAVAFAGPATAVLFFVVVGVERVALGTAESEATRYAYVFDALTFPAVAAAVTRLARPSTGAYVLALLGTLALAVDGIAGLEGWLQTNAAIQVAAHGDILAAAKLIDSGAPLAVGEDGKVEPVRTPDLTVALLRTMIASGKVPMDARTTAADALSASFYLQTSVTSEPVGSSGAPPRVGADVRPLPVSSGGGCITTASGLNPAQVRLVFDAPGSVAVIAGGTGYLGMQLAYESSPLSLTNVVNTSVAAGQRVYVNVTAGGFSPLLTLPAGVTSVCGEAQ